jgi:putative endonuclease
MSEEGFGGTIAASWRRLRQLLRPRRELPAHLRTGREGEQLAYRYLRRHGYTIVARNWRVKGCRGELDLVGWEGSTLCFIEVKTRSERGLVAAELAVDSAKQAELREMARHFLRIILRSSSPQTRLRFDVVSVYLPPGEKPQVELFKDAFAWRTMSGMRRRR